MSAVQQALAAGSAGGGGGAPSDFAASAYNSQATVSNGDFILLWFVGAGVGAPSAPTGWTRHLNTNDADGHAIALYSSTYSGSNAVADTTNFPVSNGYFFTLVYTGSHSIAQLGTLSQSAASASSVTVTALASPTTGTLAAFLNSRDQNMNTIDSSDGMTRQVYSVAPTFFDFAFFDQTGVQSGTRTFTRSSSSSLIFVFTGYLIEIA